MNPRSLFYVEKWPGSIVDGGRYSSLHLAENAGRFSESLNDIVFIDISLLSLRVFVRVFLYIVLYEQGDLT